MNFIYDLACSFDAEVKVSERLWRIQFVAELPIDPETIIEDEEEDIKD